ncbi:hypothetical protein F5X99DRAFT_237853 [Biscogniauxia marginata]|nr:hypothetical protein F5X99DRAFT_237853 [Biscogniauxia marginata]
MAFRIPSDRPGRVIGAGNIDFGRSAPANQTLRQITIPYLVSTVAGMESIQAARDAPVDQHSLAAAVFFEHRTLSVMPIVSTPFVTHLGLFSRDDDVHNAALDRIERKFDITHGIHTVTQHPMYHGICGREFSIFHVPVDDGYAVVVARIRTIDPQNMAYDPAIRLLYFREVTDIAIIDPRTGPNTLNRRALIMDSIMGIFEEGSIRLAQDIVSHAVDVPRCGDNPNLTGYYAFGITRELIRRLRVVIKRRMNAHQFPVTGLVNQQNPAFFWDDIHEDWTVDMLRQAILGCDALRAIQISNFEAYLALVVPSEAARERLADLQPPHDHDNMYPDEMFQGFDHEGPPLSIELNDVDWLLSPPRSDVSNDDDGQDGQDGPDAPPPPYGDHNHNVDIFHVAIDTPTFPPKPPATSPILPPVGKDASNHNVGLSHVAKKGKGKRSLDLSSNSGSESPAAEEDPQQPAPKRQRKTPSPTPSSKVRRSGRIAKR